MSGSISTHRDGPLGWLGFDHPERHNAISVTMWRQIPGAVRELVDDPAVRVIILRGAGDRAFVSGADISEFEENRSGSSVGAYDTDSAAAFLSLTQIPKPVLAMIHGYCVGGGLALALTADLRYGAEDARLGIPAARLGLGYHMPGIESLAQVVGLSTAKEIFFTARRFTAEEALARHLLTEVVPKARLEERVREVAGQIAENAPLTLRSVKLVTRELEKPAAARDVAAVGESIARCFASDDYKEGVAAFLQKRKPRFEGR